MPRTLDEILSRNIRLLKHQDTPTSKNKSISYARPCLDEMFWPFVPWGVDMVHSSSHLTCIHDIAIISHLAHVPLQFDVLKLLLLEGSSALLLLNFEAPSFNHTSTSTPLSVWPRRKADVGWTKYFAGNLQI